MKKFTLHFLIFIQSTISFASSYSGEQIDFTFANFKEHLVNSKATSVEEALAALPSNWLNRINLVKDSNSLQSSSPSFPRVLVSNSDASLIFTFNGNSKDRGFDKLETISFNKKSKIFELREISFTSIGPIFSKVNPPQCLACHTQDPRPIWDQYPTWKNIFGGDDDGLNTEETVLLKKILESSDRTRYQYVKKSIESYLEPHPTRKAVHSEEPYARQKYRIKSEPNSMLTQRLNYWNYARIARILRTKIDPRYKYLATALMLCEESESNLEYFISDGSIREITPNSDVTGFGGQDYFKYIFDGFKSERADIGMLAMVLIGSNTGTKVPFASPSLDLPMFLAHWVHEDSDLSQIVRVRSEDRSHLPGYTEMKYYCPTCSFVYEGFNFFRDKNGNNIFQTRIHLGHSICRALSSASLKATMRTTVEP